MAGGLPVASAAASREPAVVRARKEASWARVKGSEEEEDGAGAEVEDEFEGEGAQEVDDEKREEADAAADAQASPLPPNVLPPRPLESAEGRRCAALLCEAKRCWAGAGGKDEVGEGLDDDVEAAATEAAPAAAAAERRTRALDADADAADGDGEEPRGSGEPADAAATLVDLGDRTGALPRGRGERAGVGPAAACEAEAVAAEAEGAAAACPRPRRAPAKGGIDYHRHRFESSSCSLASPPFPEVRAARGSKGVSSPTGLANWKQRRARRLLSLRAERGREKKENCKEKILQRGKKNGGREGFAGREAKFSLPLLSTLTLTSRLFLSPASEEGQDSQYFLLRLFL